MLGLDEPSGYVVAHLEIDYVSSLTLADEAVRVDVLERVGTSSLTVPRPCRRDGRVVARSRTVAVLRDVAPAGPGRSAPGSVSAREKLVVQAS